MLITLFNISLFKSMSVVKGCASGFKNYVFIFVLIIHNINATQKHKICVENADRDACQQISRNQEFACTENIVSKVDCFINIEKNEPQFTVINDEQAVLAAPLISNNTVVLAEIRSVYAPIQTVVIVRKPFDGGFNNLKGKRLCHPGFKHNELVSKLILEEFESKVLNDIDYCNSDNVTVLEKRIKGLSSFFGPSCRPGAWTESEEFDAKLKSKYPSLCELCGVEKCAITYQVPFNETFLCLTQKGGDIAISTLVDAIIFFSNTDNVNNYQYLCPNGTVSDANKPCTWTDEVNRLIVTRNTLVDTVKAYIQENLNVHISGTTITPTTLTISLQKVLGLEASDIISLINPTPLSTYITERRTIVQNNTSPCGQKIRWCTLNNLEQEKCFWLQRAAINRGLLPFIECRQAEYNEQLVCLNDIEAGSADISFIDVNYGYSALKKGLTIVAYTETDKRQLSSILIVIRNDSTIINNLNDLKGKRACFPEYGGKEWLAFIDVLITKKVLPDSCDYGQVFSDFVGQSCTPGARDHSYGIDHTDESKLCAQCIPVDNVGTASYCNADAGNKYYGSDGALRCLLDNNADYAVITRYDVIQYQDSTEFRVLSVNGTVSQLPTIKVDDKASLTILTAGGVVAKKDNAKNEDIILMLRGIEQEFGQNLYKSFKVFEKFNDTKDLLFPDSTPGLTFGGTLIEYVENFKRLLANSEKCLNPNNGVINVPSMLIMVVLSYLVIRF